MADGAGRDHFERLTSNLSPMQKIEAGNERQSRKDKSAAPATKQDFADEKERARIMALPVHLRTAWADEQIQRKRTEGNI
ncbi:MAG TPA: hypothetical protein VHY79_20065 [Rhizomicrobium sp.]|nr:hypothetical protein [Rhizomicrobium sp.]